MQIRAELFNYLNMKSTSISPQEFIQFMEAEGLKKGYVINLDGKLIVSNDAFLPLFRFIQTSPDYKEHEGVFWEIEAETGSLYVVAIHRTNRGAGQGGTRLKQYPTVENLFTDALRLAKGMNDKNACAGLWWGGGKSIIHPNEHPRALAGEKRERVFKHFGLFIASLNGAYVCAEDMNVTPNDLRIVHAHNRYTTCVPEEIGGSANPSGFTARGVFMGLLAGVHFMEGKADKTVIDLSGKHVLLQGAGNVGWALMEEIVAAGGRVTVFDISDVTKSAIRAKFTTDQVQIEEDITTFYGLEADIFAPCAIGAILNDETIPNLKVKLIAGAANNQLKDSIAHAEALHERGILYLPDFIINRMGIVNCANEQYGYLLDTIEEKILEVYDFSHHLLQKSKEMDISPELKAMEMAEQLSRVNHPIWGHRGIKIIAQLQKDNWSLIDN